jgi:hypothetical protein
MGKTLAVDGFHSKNHTIRVEEDMVYLTVHLRVIGRRGGEVIHIELSPERARVLGSALINAADITANAR